jgi:hypothetical protein
MRVRERIALVRCRLDGPEAELASAVRFVPLGEFELWRFLMEKRHRRRVTVEAVSLWMAEEAAVWNSGFAPEELEPVLRVRLVLPGPYGVPVPVERFFPAETYPRAQEALLSHMPGGRSAPVTATPGYFLPAESQAPSPVASVASVA